MRRLGVHTSIAGGIEKSIQRALELGCTTMQIFSHNPRGWAISGRGGDECAAFRKLRDENDLSPVFIHTSYLINLASPDVKLIEKSARMVVEELNIADSLGAEYVVLHTGSASGDDPVDARKRAIACLTGIAGRGRWKAGLLLENTAGERGDITSRVAELAEIIHAVPEGLIGGVCLDTCHAFAAGYDLSTSVGRSTLKTEIDRHLGRESVKLIHLNDAKGHAGSGLDRHEHIGEGKLGIKAIRALLIDPFFGGVPLILETPKKSEEDDPRNLARVRKLLK